MQSDEEALENLERIQELNLSVEALKVFPIPVPVPFAVWELGLLFRL